MKDSGSKHVLVSIVGELVSIIDESAEFVVIVHNELVELDCKFLTDVVFLVVGEAFVEFLFFNGGTTLALVS
jgi:hypothetical protein